MNVPFFVLFIIPLTIVMFCLYMLYRNSQVYSYRIAILDEVSDAAKLDIQAGRDWQWRYEELNSVSYGEMMKYFWRDLDSFYPDKKFMVRGTINDNA